VFIGIHTKNSDVDDPLWKEKIMKTHHRLTGLLVILVLLALFSVDISEAFAAAPQITSLSPATVTRSGRLRIFGNAFGFDGQVLIDGKAAPIADWTDSLIVAYVPETSALGTVTVQVVNSGGSSNLSTIQVTARQAVGRVLWRFQHNGDYTVVRPAVAPDGTIYIVDVYSRLYALSPDGGLKWIVRGAGYKGLTVGADGTVYTGSESAIKAFNPDGSLKWTFVQNPLAFIMLGPNVGPDGNIYGVATSGIGVFALSPTGQLLWTNPEIYDRRIVDYQEVVFGANGGTQQLYFLANNHLRGLKLDGSPVFSVTTTGNQPAVGPDGTVYATYTALGAYTPNGSVKWSFSGVINNAATAPDAGPDGVVYFTHNLSTLYAVNSNGTERWHVTGSDILEGPVVNAQNTQVGMGGRPTYGVSGFFKAVSPGSGVDLWRVDLVDENGGQLVPDSRPRFSSDGQTMYMTAQILGGDQGNIYGYLYALDGSGDGGGGGGGDEHFLRSTAISLTAKLRNGLVNVTGKVTVNDENGSVIPGAVVDIQWTKPGGSIITQSATTNSKGVATFLVSGGLGTYKLTVTNLTKTGYTFDPDNSVLNKSITK
jgi:hypothetical protein